jgi:hypothetical protein
MLPKISLIFFSCIIFVAAGNAQTSKSVLGKWTFFDIGNKEGLDSAKLKSLKKVFKQMSFHFRSNGSYKNDLAGFSEEGRWAFNEKANTITMTASKGSIKDMQVLNVTADKMSVTVDEMSFILARTIAEEPAAAGEAVPQAEGISATTAQVAKKWFFKRREMPNRNEEQIKKMSEMMAGTYVDFKPGGAYETQVLQIKENGSWSFGAGNQSIIITVENEKKFWTIKTVTATQLVLIRGSGPELWYFSTVE